MNWHEIKVSADNKHFLFDNQPIYGKYFDAVLKFHAPGIAPVKDTTGAYHIDAHGNPFYSDRYQRTFGYYCNRSAVMKGEKWFHLNERGERAYSEVFSWIGNYQENICTVRDEKNRYFHIDLHGIKIYTEYYVYCGDFKDGYACVKKSNGLWCHIDICGNKLNEKEFFDLNIFHKNYATAKDRMGWHHIDKAGNELYNQRYLAAEPFYNGYALVTNFDCQKTLINEHGNLVLVLG